MKFASIDIGSNTTLLLIVQITENGMEVLSDKIYFTRLAENLEKTMQLSTSALKRLEQAFQSIRETLDKYEVKNFFTAATSASRQAENKEDLFSLASKYNLSPISIISPEREAELTFVGALFGLGQDIENPLVIDIGGGSTEIVSAKRSYSLNMGSVSLTEKFLGHEALSRIEKINLNQYIEKELESLDSFLQEDFDACVFVAGTPISLAFMEFQTFNPNEIHGKILAQDRGEFWLEKLSQLSVEERKQIKHLSEHRSDVIISGLSLLNQILKRTKHNQFIVSATGIRYGLILEQIQKD